MAELGEIPEQPEFFLYEEGPFVVRVFSRKSEIMQEAGRSLESEEYFGFDPTDRDGAEVSLPTESENVQSTWPRQTALISAYSGPDPVDMPRGPSDGIDRRRQGKLFKVAHIFEKEGITRTIVGEEYVTKPHYPPKGPNF